jgi:hypothetical protein
MRILLDALSSLFFLVLAGVLVYVAFQFHYHDGNYPAFYLAFGVWLETLYLAVWFALKAILSRRARLAERISHVLGLLLLVPIGLDILIQVLLLDQSIRGSLKAEGEVHSLELIFATLVLFLLVAPAFLILREIVSSFLRHRAQKIGAP